MELRLSGYSVHRTSFRRAHASRLRPSAVARGEDTAESDVDVLYSFISGGLPLREFFSFKRYLEDLFGREVDLVPVKWMASCVRPYIEQDMILFGAGVVTA